MGTRLGTESKGIVLRPSQPFNGVKVFSATMVAERDRLGETVTTWISANPHCKLVEIVITQSSDERFHCIAFSVFYFEQPRTKPATTGSMAR